MFASVSTPDRVSEGSGKRVGGLVSEATGVSEWLEAGPGLCFLGLCTTSSRPAGK